MHIVTLSRVLAISLALVFAGCHCAPPAEPLDAHLVDAGPLPPGGDDDEARDAGAEPPRAVVLQLDAALAPAVAARVTQLLSTASGDLVVIDADAPLPDAPLVIALGDTTLTRELLPADAGALPAEGWRRVVRAGQGGAVHVAVTGGSAAGTAYGAYALLEALGFAFLHPLAPIVIEGAPPEALVAAARGVEDASSAPRWPVRNWHMHAMHPLELTDVANGFGDASVDDRGEESWAAMLPEWDSFLEWLVANGQNELEWNLLEAESWRAFSLSDVRHARLAALVARCHAWGLRCGADVPIVQEQQHTLRLILEQSDDLDAELAQLRERADWIFAAGFDFISTEPGTTEFTNTGAARSVAWMDALTAHAEDVWGRGARIKIHASSNQVAEGFVDEETGAPVNFNHLPRFADARLGVLPHTVQHWGLDDPAPTYGHEDFHEVREFMHREAGRRLVLWHPETAYWVTFDVDVPLFLPVYAERRLADLRLLARDEDAGLMGTGAFAGSRLDGQSVFSSGWEWGYWLNDVVAARAVWDPLLDVADRRDAFVAALAPLSRALGAQGPAITALVADTALDQHELLILGRVDGVAPADIRRRNGHAYLQGVDVWDDVGDMAADLGIIDITTQPERLDLREVRRAFHLPPSYTSEIEPLLAEMAARFGASADALAALAAQVEGPGRPLADELAAALRVTALRARQVHGLYDFVDLERDGDGSGAALRLADARAALDEAAVLVAAQESRYRVPAERIAGWRTGPTAYRFGYLWMTRTLYAWWRDELLAVEAPSSPCVLNVISPIDVAMGEGPLQSGAEIVAALTASGALASGTQCLAAPEAPPSLPPPGLR